MKLLAYTALIATSSAIIYDFADCKDDFQKCPLLTKGKDTLCVKLPEQSRRSKYCPNNDKWIYFQNLTGKTVTINFVDEKGESKALYNLPRNKTKRYYTCPGSVWFVTAYSKSDKSYYGLDGTHVWTMK